MNPDRSPKHVLVVAQGPALTPDLVEAVRRRADAGPAEFRVVVPNPAHAEVHLFHPERHDEADAAEYELLCALPQLEEAAGGRITGTVSVRHDPMDAVEEILFSEPVDEIILALVRHPVSERLHQDLAHRLAHHGLPITVLDWRPRGS